MTPQVRREALEGLTHLAQAQELFSCCYCYVRATVRGLRFRVLLWISHSVTDTEAG